MEVQGLTYYSQFLMAFINEVMAHLFDLSSATSSYFYQDPGGSGEGTVTGQWYFSGTEWPDLTAKGQDIIAAIMTIAHNGLVAVAQLSTLLPANILTP